MKVFKYGPESFPIFTFVYDEKIDKFYDTLRVKSGPLGKWSFKKVSKEYVKVYHKEYKGDFPPEVKREVIYGIFGRGRWD